MEESMKRMAKIAAVLAAVVLIVTACPGTGPDGPDVPSGMGLVNVRIGGAARTVVPGLVDAGKFTYDLLFTPADVSDPVGWNGKDYTGLIGITLNPGTYSLTLTAYTGEGDGRKEAAVAVVESIVVEDGEETEVPVALTFKPEAGDGTLGFTITRPESITLTGARFVLTPLHEDGTTYGEDWLNPLYISDGASVPLSHSGNETLASGYYKAVVTLLAEGLKAVKYDIVHIGAGQTTTLDWAFAAEDFSANDNNNINSSAVNIWLLGAGDQWEIYANDNKLTQEDDGTFVVRAGMTGESPRFRFSLDNTTEWTSDKDKPKRFQPGVDDTLMVPGEPAPMTLVGRNEGEPTAWKLDRAGRYRFVVNYDKKTVTVTSLENAEKLDAVQGLALSAEGIAAWSVPEDETGIGAYSIQIWKGVDGNNTEEGDRIQVPKGEGKTDSGYSYNLLSVLREKSPGWYGISIKAIAANDDYDDSDDTGNAVDGVWREVEKRADVQYVWWFETTKARWVNVDGVSDYIVQLYRDGVPVGGSVVVPGGSAVDPGNETQTVTTHDFTSGLTAGGSYTFGVKTKGDNRLILDGDEKKSAASSPPNQGGDAAAITLAPANKSGSLVVTGGGASIARNGGSLTVSVTGGAFTSFSWIVDGVGLSGQAGASITLNGSNYNLGGHSVTVYALDTNGVPWSPVAPISFTVTAR
jgi:hypothetical protein